MDVAHGEKVEAELTAFIERRSRKGDVDPDEQEEIWKASVRALHRPPARGDKGGMVSAP